MLTRMVGRNLLARMFSFVYFHEVVIHSVFVYGK